MVQYVSSHRGDSNANTFQIVMEYIPGGSPLKPAQRVRLHAG